MEKSLIPKDLLFELFDCAFGVGPRWEDQWRPPEPPSAEDVRHVEFELDVRLPLLLVELALRSRYFTRWFAELGPDRSSKLHILAVNERLRKQGKPGDLIVLTHAYDGDCVGLVRGGGSPSETSPIVFFPMNLWGSEHGARRVLAPDFRAYLEDLCRDQAPRSRVKSLRRKAKRLLASWQNQS